MILIALYKIVQENNENMGLNLEGTLTKICEGAQINRTQVYEYKKQIEGALAKIELNGPGRPPNSFTPDAVLENQGVKLREKILRYRLEHPGSIVAHKQGYNTYSDGFIRFILDLHDEWENSAECFCKQVEVPYQTFNNWCKRDKKQPYLEFQNRPLNDIPATASKVFRQIAEDYSIWEGSLRDFFKFESPRIHLGPEQIRRVLLICKMLPVRSSTNPRYRGSTQKRQPGSILVTDGKDLQVIFTATGEVRKYNWQGIVDQATVCHTATVVSETECADSVSSAFDASCEFLGRAPLALLHDNKPIHSEQKLKAKIEKTTLMIPATLNRAQNKADIEGEFGKYEREVGTIYLDDTNEETLKKSAVLEVIRGYTAGINHAGRFEYDGKSRQQVLKEACPDPEKDRKFIEQLHASHTQKHHADTLPTKQVNHNLLDIGFKRFGLEKLDKKGKVKQWLAGRYTTEAIRQALAIFGAEYDKGRLRNKTAHRYLVKLIQSRQEEIDLRKQEDYLREFAMVQQQHWLHDLESDYATLVAEFDEKSPDKNLAFRISENAVFGGLCLQRTFWENKLKNMLNKQRNWYWAVCNHVRRLFEATWEDRFSLLSKLTAWEVQLAR